VHLDDKESVQTVLQSIRSKMVTFRPALAEEPPNMNSSVVSTRTDGLTETDSSGADMSDEDDEHIFELDERMEKILGIHMPWLV
jgi:hypothetical protein